MIKPNKSRLFDAIFGPYCRNLLRRNFNSLRIDDPGNLLQKDGSKLIVSNHSSWWDGLIAYQISRHFRHNAFVMMEEKQLKQFWLFRYLGAFSVVREDPGKAAGSLLFALRLLEKAENVLWIFPEGEIVPNNKRPVEVFKGAEVLAEKSTDTEAMIVAMRYEYLDEPKADIFLKVASLHHEQEVGSQIESCLDAISSDVANSSTNDYSDILRRA